MPGTPPILANLVADRIGEVALAAATIIAVVLLAYTLPLIIRRRGGRAGLTPALVILTGAAAITFASYIAFAVRCAETGCRVRRQDAVGGLYPWWRQENSWQWGGQLALASVALVLASLALALAARRRRSAKKAVILARVAVVLWALVVFLIPAGWEILFVT